MERIARVALHAQAVLYITTGLWPVFDLSSFEAVTGEKYDDFLVQTVGLLLCVVGLGSFHALRRRRDDNKAGAEWLWIAAGTAASLAAIDIVYWINGRLRDLYLMDAAAEIVFALAATTLWTSTRGAAGPN